MKKKYVITSFLTLVIATLFSAPSFAQVRITQVDPSTNVVTIHNYGGSTVDISNYYFCQWPIYLQIQADAMTVNSGSLNLAAEDDVNITSLVNFGISDGEFGLYTAAAWPGFTTNMVDYLEWGTSGHVREPVAVAAGIWSAGTTITVPAPYEYTGDGTQNGVTFWGTVLGVGDFENKIVFNISPNPVTSILNIQLSKNIIDGNIKVFDILGKQILTKELNPNNLTRINVSNLSNGMYLVKVTSGENTQTKRFIKE